MTLAEILIGKTPEEKVRICVRVLERLRERHNEVGEQFRNGVITEDQWRSFLALWEGRHQRVSRVMNVIKDNQGWFFEVNKDVIAALKQEGKVLTTYDGDIDIETL